MRTWACGERTWVEGDTVEGDTVVVGGEVVVGDDNPVRVSGVGVVGEGDFGGLMNANPVTAKLIAATQRVHSFLLAHANSLTLFPSLRPGSSTLKHAISPPTSRWIRVAVISGERVMQPIVASPLAADAQLREVVVSVK